MSRRKKQPAIEVELGFGWNMPLAEKIAEFEAAARQNADRAEQLIADLKRRQQEAS